MSITVDDADASAQRASAPGAPGGPGVPFSRALPPLIKRNTVLLALTQAFVGMGNQTTPTLAPIIVVHLLGSAALSGLGSSILGFSRLIVAYPVGWLTDTYGRKAGLMLGMVLTLIGTLVLGAAMLLASFALFVVGLVIFGLGAVAAPFLIWAGEAIAGATQTDRLATI